MTHTHKKKLQKSKIFWGKLQIQELHEQSFFLKDHRQNYSLKSWCIYWVWSKQKGTIGFQKLESSSRKKMNSFYMLEVITSDYGHADQEKKRHSFYYLKFIV